MQYFADQSSLRVDEINLRAALVLQHRRAMAGVSIG